MAISIRFPNSYQESREDFLDQFQLIHKHWPDARLESRPISEEDDLQIEWIAADALTKKQKALIITCGLHGMEGYAGAGMRSLFLAEFLDSIDPGTTGLYLVHAINPWGMENKRRVTRNNVDLNRNFLLDESGFKEEINPDYQLYDHILNPDRPLRPLWREIIGVAGSVVSNLVRSGVTSLRNAVLQGQRFNSRGIYYSGNGYEPETRILMDLLKSILADYPEALLIDMHTGYGPKYQMAIINSPDEKRSGDQLAADFHYPLVLKADPEEFYTMQGDMVNWLYDYRVAAGMEGKFYAAAFEFGTIGNSIPHELISLWNMIFENQAFYKGIVEPRTKQQVIRTFLEMFIPSERRWRDKALADCRQALQGILSYEGYLE